MDERKHLPPGEVDDLLQAIKGMWHEAHDRLSRIQADMHPAAKRGRDVDQGIQREPRQTTA